MDTETKRTSTANKFLEGVSPLVKDAGFDIYDFDYTPNSKESKLRLFIKNFDCEKAIEIDDCVKVDHLLSDYFEENDWIPENIVLEVSSPGLFSSLRNKRHFDLAISKRIKLYLNIDLNETLKAESKKKKKELIAILKSVSQTLVSVIDEQNIEYDIEFKNIKKANLEPEF